MIRFFRQLRKNLLMESKTSKYFKYAIGEILLVVIGILIALGINNWNENRKLELEETKLLNALIKETQANLEIVDTLIIDNDTISKRALRSLNKGLKDSNFSFKMRDVVRDLGYNTNNYETSILNEILGTNSRSIIANTEIISELRSLKQAYNRSDDTQFYVDAFWNDKVTDFLNSRGLGVYIAIGNTPDGNNLDIQYNKGYLSLLGLMYSYQNSLLRSRKDLKKAIEHSLKFLEDQNIDYHD